MEPAVLPEKKDVAQQLLLRGSVFVHLDPRPGDVEVPAWFADRPQLVLQIGLDLPIPIPDLRVDDDGVFGTLSFSREGHYCRIPWDAVFALVGEDGRGMVWPDDLPLEIASEVEREAARGRELAREARDEDRAHSQPSLSVVEGGSDASSSDARPRGERPPYLRVVK